MKNKCVYNNLKCMTIPETNEVVNFVDNVQVDYFVVMEKVDLNADDKLSSFKPVKEIVGAYTLFTGKIRDIFSNEIYSYCRINDDCGTKYIKYNIKSKAINEKYIVISYSNFICEEYMEKIANEEDAILRHDRFIKLGQYIQSKLQETFKTENDLQKIRTKN